MTILQKRFSIYLSFAFELLILIVLIYFAKKETNISAWNIFMIFPIIMFHLRLYSLKLNINQIVKVNNKYYKIFSIKKFNFYLGGEYISYFDTILTEEYIKNE